MALKWQNIWGAMKKGWHFFVEECIKFPAYILVHPFKGYDLFKREKRAKMSVALIFVALLMFLNILSYQYQGFLVGVKDINDLNAFAEVAYVIVPILILVFANWSITTLFDGKGKVIEIFMMISYSLFPMIVTQLIGLIIGNVIVMEEFALYQLVLGIGVFGTALMAFTGLVSIHEYGIFKCIITIVFTILAALVILFVGLLIFDLFQRIYGFVYTVYREIMLRYL